MEDYDDNKKKNLKYNFYRKGYKKYCSTCFRKNDTDIKTY